MAYSSDMNTTPSQEDTMPDALTWKPTREVRVLDTDYHRDTGQHLDFTRPGAWDLTGRTAGGREFITSHDGPFSAADMAVLGGAYPEVTEWQARPAAIDETYHDGAAARGRLVQLLGVPEAVAHAILTIAATDELGWRFAYGRFEVTGDDDDQSFRIRTIGPGPETVLVPVSREQARLVTPVLRDWANAGHTTVACLGVANAIDQAVTGGDPPGWTRAQEEFVRARDEWADKCTAETPCPVDNAGRPYEPPTWK
jgi:hypothetical protein